MRQSNFITKCDRLLLQSTSGITKCDRMLLQSASGITKCDSYYKVRRNIDYVYFYFFLSRTEIKEIFMERECSKRQINCNMKEKYSRIRSWFSVCRNKVVIKERILDIQMSILIKYSLVFKHY